MESFPAKSRMRVATAAQAAASLFAKGEAGLIQTVTKLPSDSTARIEVGRSPEKCGARAI